MVFSISFQSRKAAEHILMGDWRRQGVILTLDWWSPTKGSFPIQTKFDWFWIRVHGLPLHLWSTSVMKEIGDKCGGWRENEEETELKNHLRWARIRVKDLRETMPLSIDVDDGNLIFSMPIWVESPAVYKKKEIVTNPRQVTIAGKGETRVVLGCGKYMKTFHEKGKEVVGPNRFCGVWHARWCQC
uniref:Putative ovule protein n=1 Tax=Solanum chacoense TaxID=4108 RepID=A0A0V0HDM9_SOLCH